MNFQKLSGVLSPSPDSSPRFLPAQSWASPSIRASTSYSRALHALGSGFAFSSPPICSIISLNRGELDEIFVHPLPSTSTSLLRHCTQYIQTVSGWIVKRWDGGWPKNFISLVYTLTKIVGLEGWGGGFNPPPRQFEPCRLSYIAGRLGPPNISGKSAPMVRCTMYVHWDLQLFIIAGTLFGPTLRLSWRRHCDLLNQ